MHSVLDSDCTEEGNIHVLLISMLTLSHPQHYFPDVLFSLWSHKKYLNFGSLGMLGLKLLPELISAMTLTTPTINRFSIKALRKCQPCIAEKWATNTGNGGHTRKESLFLSLFMPKRTEMVLLLPTKAFYK